MPDIATITGFVATDPRHLTTGDGLPITSFRLASNQRRFDRSKNVWVDTDTNWYTISAFRQIALNTNSSIHKGDRVVVTGRLRVREWDNGTRKGTSIEIDVDAIGHDLAWGTTAFTRNALPNSTAQSTDPHEEQSEFEDQGDGGSLDDAAPSNRDSSAAFNDVNPVTGEVAERPSPFDPDDAPATTSSEAQLA